MVSQKHWLKQAQLITLGRGGFLGQGKGSGTVMLAFNESIVLATCQNNFSE